ncbi:MAG TPA: class I SAM-dependent methyltransferase [Candidatus Binatia bacterium]|nr:class I SAM-dependent methyltransferase [Candidatus Binatia bacterium]
MLRSNRIVSKDEAKDLGLSQRIALEADITDRRVQIVELERLVRRAANFDRFFKIVPWRRQLLDFLSPLTDRLILDLGCGYAMTPVMFALLGARVVALDVAPKTLATVARVAQKLGVDGRVQTVLAPGEYLPFASGSFDRIHGGAALHHLQLRKAGPEIFRVLKEDGKAGFSDPLGHNVLLEFVRDRIPYRKKHPEKATDRPLHLKDVKLFCQSFASAHYQTFQLCSMLASVARLSPSSPLRSYLQRIDAQLFARFPSTQKYARKVIICVGK